MSDAFCRWRPSHFTDLWTGGEGKVDVTGTETERSIRGASFILPTGKRENHACEVRRGTLHVGVCVTVCDACGRTSFMMSALTEITLN